MTIGTALNSGSPSSLRVTIGRLTARLRLPQGVGDAAEGQARLIRTMERDVARVCARVLTPLPDDDEAVYRIRRLHFHLYVDARTMTEAEIAERIGTVLAGSIRRAMLAGDAPEVVRFDSPHQFVASFIRDLLDGRAWSQWYYAEFRPLQQLATPAIALELLLARPEWIVPVLGDLASTGHVDRLIEGWQSSDVERLWMALGFHGPTLTLDGIDVVGAAWDAAGRSGALDASGRARDRLRVWLRLFQLGPQAAGDARLAGLIHAWVDLAALLRLEPDLGPLLAMESGIYPAALQRLARGPLADTVGWLANLSSSGEGRASLAQVARRVGQGDTRTRARVTSPIGSVFLLLPGLIDLDVWTMWRSEWGEELARRAMAIVALKALGRAQAPLYLNDRGLALFAGLKEPPTADSRLAPEAETVSAGGQPRYPGAWVARLPTTLEHWLPPHSYDLARGSARGIVVEREMRVGAWLAAWPAETPAWPGSLDRPVRPMTAEEEAALDVEAAHLQLGQSLGYAWLTPRLDAALSVIASLTVRRLAARLPRFTQASLPYLARQFLAQPATLEADSERLLVHISGPLTIVLKLAAWPETLDVPWLDRPVRLTIAGS